MTRPGEPFPIPPTPEGLGAMSDADVELFNAVSMAWAMGLATQSILEGLKGGRWFHGAGAAAALVIGAGIGPLIPQPERVIATFGLVVASAIGIAGGEWHRRRGLRILDDAKGLAATREMIRAEIARRGLCDD